MKSKRLIKKVLFFCLIVMTVSSCSEFLLVPITVDYPFDKDNPASPSEYEINIDEGLGLVDKVMKKDVSKNLIENNLKKEFPGSEISVSIVNSEMTTEDMIDIISGEEVEKEFEYSASINPPEQDEIIKNDTMKITISICDFFNEEEPEDPVFYEENIAMTIVNTVNFCKLSQKEKTAKINNCKMDGLSLEELKTCTHINVKHENTSISIMLAEVKELKSYKQYLDKIYSATLNNISFTILEKPDIAVENKTFILEAELFCQPVKSFDENGNPCEFSTDKGCVSKGVDYSGNIENYFSDGDNKNGENIREKYLVGVFGTNTFGEGEKLDLLYTYEGKDILQKGIKKLDFQIGAKSYYLFFPQAKKPQGKLTMDIEAKLLFNVEPLN